MGITTVSAALFAGVAFCASGLGHLFVGRVPMGNPRRALAAEFLVGLLAYSTLFGVAAHAGLRSSTALALAPLLALVGVLGCLHAAGFPRASAPARGFLRALGIRALVALGIGASLLALRAVRGSPMGPDPRHYAFGAATMFHDAWLRGIALPPDAHAWLLELKQLVSLTRAPGIALLWPPAALGWGVDGSAVSQLGVWFLVVAFVLQADTLSGYAPLVVRLVLAAAGVGAFNATAILIGAHIAQVAALAAALAGVWVCRFTEAPRPRLVALVLVGNFIASAYPEFLLALPLYLGCALALRFTSWPRAVGDGLAVVVGALAAELSTGFIRRYLVFMYMTTAPGWRPLPETPRGLGEIWTMILFQRSPRALALVLTLILVGASIWWWRSGPPPTISPRCPVWATVTGFAIMLGLWSWAVVGALNVNYAVFKLSGWLGPGLMLLGCALLQPLRPGARWVFAAVLLTIAVTRCLALAGELPKLTRVSPWRPTWAMETGPMGVPCAVRAASERTEVVLTAVAESGAAARGCAFTISPLAALASLYEARPPGRWRPDQRRVYVVTIENAGTDTWKSDGPLGVELGVRFRTPGADLGRWKLFSLPGSVPPGARTAVRVEIAAPSDGGAYLLEHRLTRGGTTWSEQGLLAEASVR